MYKNSLMIGRTASASSLSMRRDGLKHHPLVRATRHIDSELKDLAKRVQHSKGRWHDMQMLRLQNPEPFLVAYRKGLDWRAYLDERCILGVAAEPSPLEIRPPPPPTTTKKRRSRSTTPPVVVSAPAVRVVRRRARRVDNSAAGRRRVVGRRARGAVGAGERLMITRRPPLLS